MKTADGNFVEQTVTFKSEDETIVGKTLLPRDYESAGKLPAFLVLGPWTQVKEQVQYAYGKQLAERGFAVLNFDFRFWGESGGEPRYVESTAEKMKDAKNALSYLKRQSYVDVDNLNVIGVCAGAGIAMKTFGQEKDVAHIATVAAWLQHPSTTPVFYGGEGGIKQRIAMSREAKTRFDNSNIADYVEAYNPNNTSAAMFFPLDYYGNPERGAIPQWTNKFAVMGWEEWMLLNSIDDVAEKVDRPVVMIHSDGSALPDNVKKFYEKMVNDNKKLVWLEGEHTEFYDRAAHIERAVNEILAFCGYTMQVTN